MPKSGPVIIAATHTATLDPMLLGCAFPRPLSFMAKEELFRVPFFGAFFRALGAFPVKRGRPDRRALRKALSILKTGQCLVIFPEGTRNPHRQLQEPELGVALLAAQTKAPVLPVALLGSEQLMPKGKLFPRPTAIEVRVGNLMSFKGDGSRASLEQFAWQIMTALSGLSGRPLPKLKQGKAREPSGVSVPRCGESFS